MLTMIQIVLLFIIIATSIPAGMLLAYLCRDELVAGRKWFKIIGIVCAVLVWALIFLYNDLVVTGTIAYIGILASIALVESGNKKLISLK